MIHFNQSAGLSDLPRIVDYAITDLDRYAAEFDSIAAQGSSGLIVASPVALALRKPLVIVRSNTDLSRSHCSHIRTVENINNAGRRILFLDDYVGEGKTLHDVISKLSACTRGSVSARYEYLYRDYKTGSKVLETRF